MTKTEQDKAMSAGTTAGGAIVGVATATIAKKMLAAKIPVPMSLVNLGLGAGVGFFALSQKGAVQDALIGVATGHVIVGAFDGAKTLSLPGIPTINGMRGMRGGMPYYGNEHSLITAGAPIDPGMEGVEEDAMFVSMSGAAAEEVAKSTFEYN
jgi:hypothetical protein